MTKPQAGGSPIPSLSRTGDTRLDDDHDWLFELDGPRDLLEAVRARQHRVGEEEHEYVRVEHPLPHSLLGEVVGVHVAPAVHAQLLELVHSFLVRLVHRRLQLLQVLVRRDLLGRELRVELVLVLLHREVGLLEPLLVVIALRLRLELPSVVLVLRLQRRQLGLEVLRLLLVLSLLLELIVRNVPVCGLELVEVSPPYDISDMTSLMATRVICDTMAHLVVSGQLPRKDKPSWINPTCNMQVDQAWR